MSVEIFRGSADLHALEVAQFQRFDENQRRENGLLKRQRAKCDSPGHRPG